MWQVKIARFLSGLKSLLARAGLTRLPLVKQLSARAARMFLRRVDQMGSQAVSIKLRGINLVLPKRFYSHYVLHEYEPVTQRVFTELIRPGMTVVDVGAHIGYYSLLAARAVGQAGAIHAVEPCEENLSYLRQNISLNGFNNIQVHPYAAGRERGRRTFHITGSSDSHGFYPHPLTTTLETVEMTEMPLDEIIDGNIDAVKIDVEGVELMVLEGMSRIINENRNLIVWVEWMPACMKNAGYDPADLPAYLERLGFGDIQVLDDHDMKRRPLDEVLPLVRSGNLPSSWYVNLLARRS